MYSQKVMWSSSLCVAVMGPGHLTPLIISVSHKFRIKVCTLQDCAGAQGMLYRQVLLLLVFKFIMYCRCYHTLFYEAAYL